MAKITTLLFDCDNTLVLSEDLAFAGCADLLNQICQLKHVPLPQPFTGATLMVDFVGQNFRGMLTTLQQRHGFALDPAELDGYVRREEDVVIAKLEAALRPCPGVAAVLARLAAGAPPRPTLAVVSSSALRRVRVSLDAAGLAAFFGDRVFSAATSLPTPTSKPDPAIYLHALAALGAGAGEAVAIEDSKSGTLSGTRAGIKVVGYVGPYAEQEKEKMRGVLKEAGAMVVMEHWDEFEAILAKIEAGEL